MEDKQLIDTLMLAMGQMLANVHTASIARVTLVNAKTINCQPVIARVVQGEAVALPEFVEVPPVFLQGGGSYTAHPIAVGDYCLLVFTERCFDRWYAGQDGLRPLELRMHDYSDGLAIVGINPLASAITIPTVIQQTGDTNQDGDYTHQGDRTQTGNHTQTGDRTLTGNVIHTGDYTVTGDLTVDGNIICTGNVSAASFSGPAGGTMVAQGNIETAGEVTAGGKNLSTHTHAVTTAPGETATPT